MNTHLKTLALGVTIVAGLAATPALYAQSYLSMPRGSMMGEGMMSGMMSMSGDMGRMTEHCNEMMQAMDDGHADRPNDQWRSPQPEQPGQPRG